MNHLKTRTASTSISRRRLSRVFLSRDSLCARLCGHNKFTAQCYFTNNNKSTKNRLAICGVEWTDQLIEPEVVAPQQFRLTGNGLTGGASHVMISALPIFITRGLFAFINCSFLPPSSPSIIHSVGNPLERRVNETCRGVVWGAPKVKPTPDPVELFGDQFGYLYDSATGRVCALKKGISARDLPAKTTTVSHSVIIRIIIIRE